MSFISKSCDVCQRTVESRAFRLTVYHRTLDTAVSEARKFQHVDVRGECFFIFLIESCEISLHAHFLSLLIHR